MGVHELTSLQTAVAVTLACILIVGGVAWLCAPAAVVVAGVLLLSGSVLLYDKEADGK